MADESQEVQEQPSQIYDADNDKWIDNPLLKAEEEEASEEEKPSKKPEKEGKEAESEESEESEKEEEETEEVAKEEESEEEEQESETKAKKKEEEDDSLDPDQYIAQTYGEKYGLKTEAELTNVIENAMDLMDELDEVKKERDTLKADSGKPKFASEKAQKAFDFISQYDVDRQGEALDTYAKLISMDPDNTDGIILLEEQYVHQHPEWTRAEAQRMFKKEHARKYTLKRESFDGTDEEYTQEQEDLKIMEKGDVARAKSYLKEQKAKYKPAEKQEAQAPEAITSAIKKNASDYTAFLSKVEELSLGTGADKYKFKLDAEQREQLSEAFDKWVKNPANYNEKGQIVGIENPQEMLDRVTGALFLNEIVDSLKSQIKNQVETKRVDEIAKNPPKKRAAPAGGDVSMINKDDLDEQARRLIKTRKAA